MPPPLRRAGVSLFRGRGILNFFWEMIQKKYDFCGLCNERLGASQSFESPIFLGHVASGLMEYMPPPTNNIVLRIPNLFDHSLKPSNDSW